MRPVKPKVLAPPHEPVTHEYFQHQCHRHAIRSRSTLMFLGRKKHTKREIKQAYLNALALESTMTYKQILERRAKVFFNFVKLVPTVDNFFYPEEIDNQYLVDGISALCEFRLRTHKGGHSTNHRLSETFSNHLMRAIDTTGNRVLSEEEFLEFLLPTKLTKRSKKKHTKMTQKTDLHYRSVEELVKLMEAAQKALKAAGIEDGIDEEEGGNEGTNNPQYHLEKARQELLERMGSTVLERDQALSVAHMRTVVGKKEEEKSE